MKLHEIDFESGIEFKRAKWKQFVQVCNMFIHWVNTDNVFKPEIVDILADDWEYKKEEKVQWYKHEYAYYRDKGEYVIHDIITNKNFKNILSLRSAIRISVNQKIDKPEWVEE